MIRANVNHITISERGFINLELSITGLNFDTYGKKIQNKAGEQILLPEDIFD